MPGNWKLPMWILKSSEIMTGEVLEKVTNKLGPRISRNNGE